MNGPPERRYAILAEGRLPGAKTAHGVLRYGRDEVVAVLDSTLAGETVAGAMPGLLTDPKRDAPIVATLEEAIDLGPTSILVGVAPAGGKLPGEWMEVLRAASEAGLEIVAGLHQRLAPEFPGARVWDVREPPSETPIFSGEGFGVQPKVALTVGTDAAIGKMTATLEIERAANRSGVSTAFVPTGQTGIIIAGWGVCVDAVVSDFVAGVSEMLVLEAARSSPDLILVEGQGALSHPAYSGVTLGLLHGSCPDALILCVSPEDAPGYAGVPRPAPSRAARLYEEVSALVKPAPVVAISANTKGLTDEEARAFVDKVSDATGLPATDPFRQPAEPILEAILVS
jgi:uncharacterized NAD-dependent epimerase/dehydratase family protein